MQSEKSILDRIQRRQLKWYGHLLRMEGSRWPKKIYQWTLHGRRRRGRQQQSWRNQVTVLLFCNKSTMSLRYAYAWVDHLIYVSRIIGKL